MNLKTIFDFLQIDDDSIRFFFWGGTGAIVSGIGDNKKKSFRRFIAIAFVGAAMSAFGAPAIIEYYGIESLRYQMLIGFLVGIGSMVLVGKVIAWFKALSVTKVNAEEGEQDV